MCPEWIVQCSSAQVECQDKDLGGILHRLGQQRLACRVLVRLVRWGYIRDARLKIRQSGSLTQLGKIKVRVEKDTEVNQKQKYNKYENNL